MRRGARGIAVVLAGLVVTLTIGPAYAATPSREVVGGPLLSRDGIVVNKESGVPKLPKVSASSYVIADYETGRVLAAKDPHGRYRPASTIKILTAITLIPQLEPDEKVRPTQHDCNVEGSKVGITPKMKYRVDDLFRGLLLASGNDAALALARAAGGLDHTLELMNATAERLRAYDTVAKTPHGLDRKGQRTSAYDLALLARHGLGMPDFRDYITTVHAKFPAPNDKSYQIATHNRLLLSGPDHYDGAIGVKNGWTSKAGGTFVGAAKRDGHTIIIALMDSKPYFWKDARQLLNWGFDARGKAEPVGTLVEPTPTATPTPSPAPASASPSPAGVASAEASRADGILVPVVGGFIAAVVLASATTGTIVILRRRRRVAP